MGLFSPKPYQFHVVNSGYGITATAGTHLMYSNTPDTPSGCEISRALFGVGETPKNTLCGRPAKRNVSDVFSPGEAGCRECKARYRKWIAQQVATQEKATAKKEKKAEAARQPVRRAYTAFWNERRILIQAQIDGPPTAERAQQIAEGDAGMLAEFDEFEAQPFQQDSCKPMREQILRSQVAMDQLAAKRVLIAEQARAAAAKQAREEAQVAAERAAIAEMISRDLEVKARTAGELSARASAEARAWGQRVYNKTF